MSVARRFAPFLVVTSLVVAACGSNDQQGGGDGGGGGAGASGAASGSQAPAASGGDVSGELTVWAMGNEGALLGDFVDLFSEEYPDVEVSVTPVDWGQAVAKLQTAIGGGQTPDVSQMGTDMMAQFAATGALETVPSNFAADQFFESAWNTSVVDDTVYGVPWYVETRVLYYRTDLAEEGGISEPPGNWEDLKAAAEAIKEGGADWGIALGPKNAQEYLPFLWSNGGQIMSDDGTFTLDSPEAIEALEFYDSFFEEELTPKEVPEGFDITPAFVEGTHPMMFSGPWHIGLITEAGGDAMEGNWAVAPMPGKDGPPGTSFVGGSNLVVYKDSENKDAAWAFVEFMTRPETQIAWYEEATVLPAVTSAWEDDALAGDENLAVFGDQLESTQAPPAVETWAEISEAINSNLERVTVGNTSPEEGAKAMQEAAAGIGTGG